MNVSQTTALMAATLRKVEKAVMTIYADLVDKVEGEHFSAYRVGAVVRVDIKLPWVREI